MFGLPAPTAYDLRFRLFRIPVTVSPYFWLISILLVGGLDPKAAIIWVGAVFVSILIHEFGHALTAKAFGFRPQVVLYGMGGLCASEAERQTFGQRLAVLIMGPGAQFLLLAALILASGPLFGLSLGDNWELAKDRLGLPSRMIAAERGDPTTLMAYDFMFQINWLWPLLNLLPIWPLDGGQITSELLGKANPREGRRWAHIVSMIVAAAIAFYLLYQSKGNVGGNLFRILFFGFFAFSNYQILQLYHHHYTSRGPDDDPEWWTRR